jgi:hypothetical protein
MHKIHWIHRTRVPAAVAAGLAAFLAVAVCAADERSHDVWLISTRSAPWSNPVGGEDRIAYWHLDTERNWASAGLDAFLAADDPAVPTCIYIHGNRTGRTSAVREGWSVSQRIKREAPDRALRFVIWSWPADQIQGLRRDVQVKAYRSEVQAYYLAHLLSRVDPEVPVSLIGYSFGARTITGALHLLAGGRFAGRQLPEGSAPAERTPVRAVLVAAAMNADWLAPGRRNGLAIDRAERILVTRNMADPVLRYYPMMYRARGPEAMGYVGMACRWQLGEDRDKVEVLPVERSVGGNHVLSGYLCAVPVRSRLAWYTFLEAPQGEAGASDPGAPAPEAEAPAPE